MSEQLPRHATAEGKSFLGLAVAPEGGQPQESGRSGNSSIPTPVVRMSPAQERALEQTAFAREALSIARRVAAEQIAEEDAA